MKSEPCRIAKQFSLKLADCSHGRKSAMAFECLVFTLEEVWQIIVGNRWSNNPASGALVIPAPCGLIWGRDDCACVDVCGSAGTLVTMSVCLFVYNMGSYRGRVRVPLSEVEMFDQLFPFEDK